MLIIDVYVVSATANCERLVLHILSMLVDKRCVQFLILWETPSSDITDLTQLDDISFLEDTVRQIPTLTSNYLPGPRSSNK